jgi:hypothetical protein
MFLVSKDPCHFISSCVDIPSYLRHSPGPTPLNKRIASYSPSNSNIERFQASRLPARKCPQVVTQIQNIESQLFCSVKLLNSEAGLRTIKDGNIYTILSHESIKGDSHGIIRGPMERLYSAEVHGIEILKLSSPLTSLLSKVGSI